MGRLRGFLWLMAGLVVASLAGVVAFVTLSQAAPTAQVGEEAARPTVRVVAAARAVALRSTLTSEDLLVMEVPVESVPQGAVADVAQAEGRITLVDLYPGEILLAQRLLDPNAVLGDGRTAIFMAENEVLVAYPADDLLTRMSVLKPGDRVDVHISFEFPTNRALLAAGATAEAGEEEKLVTFIVLQNVGIAALVGGQQAGTAPGAAPGPPQAILFTMSPQDALVLKHLKDAGGIQDIVLRAPGAEQPFDTEPVDVDYVINRYQIPVGATP